jgi:uncharacterized protein YqfB (UPF0267 family)
MGLYTTLEGIDNSNLFKFILIIIIGYIVFRNKNVGLNILLGIGCAILVIFYIYDKNKVLLETINDEYMKKLDTIEPSLKTDSKNNRDIIDFLFSIQDFYGYNPPAYEEMVDNINAILKLETILDNTLEHYEKYYEIAYSKKNNAVNCLNSIIYTIPVNGIITDKLTRAHKRLETLLINKLNKLYDKCYQNLKITGYNVHTNIINTGPNPANTYFNKDYTFQLY